jgi:anti-sigma-K factor RskA
VSDPGNHDDPRARDEHPSDLHATAQQDIASLALGEPIDPAIDEHVRSCPLCLRDLDAYRHVAALARAGKDAADTPSGPPPQVWERIAAELGVAPAAETTTPPSIVRAAPTPAAPRPPRLRRALLAAAAVVAVAGAGVAGWAIGHRTATTATDRSSQARLTAQPGTPAAASGKAIVHRSDNGYTLSVDAAGLPAAQGYYEVWLFNPSINQMVAVGTLGSGGRGSFTVPDGIDLSAYHVVDVSAQKYDGNNNHERSVLRGALAP